MLRSIITFWSTLLLGLHVEGNCRLTDITNVIGGSDYEVLSMQATHVTAGVASFLFITATINRTGLADNNVLLYLYDYSMCESHFRKELTGINQGITDISTFNSNAVALGYNLESDGSYTEFVLVMQIENPTADPYVRITEAFKEPITTASKTAFVGSWFGTEAFLFLGTNSVFIALKNNIRKYDRGAGKLTQYDMPANKIVSFAGFDGGSPVVVSLTSTTTQIDFFKEYDLGTLLHSF